MSDQMNYDIVEWLEQHVLEDPAYQDVDRTIVHGNMVKTTLGQAKDYQTDGAVLDYIHGEIRSAIFALDLSNGDTEVTTVHYEKFESEIWPELRERIRLNSGLVSMMLQYGMHSVFIVTALMDMVHHPALLIALGHGLGHTLDDTLVQLPVWDLAWRFMKDESFSLFRFRTEAAQIEMMDAKNVLMLGGGVGATLVVRDYPLGDMNQQVTIYDADACMQDYLRQLLDGVPGAENVYFHGEDFLPMLHDASQEAAYDFVEVLGVAAYYHEPEDEAALFGGIAKVLAPGGKVVFDLQTMSVPTLPFDGVIMGWNGRPGDRKMHVFGTQDEAIANAKGLCEKYGLVLDHYSVEDIERPAGVVFVARKPK